MSDTEADKRKCSSYAELSGGLGGLLEMAIGHMRGTRNGRLTRKQMNEEADWLEAHAALLRTELAETIASEKAR